MSSIALTDLATVVDFCGKVFEGLHAGRADTEEFLRSGDMSGVSSMHDLALLHDLKPAATVVVDHAPNSVDPDLVIRLNAAMARSASIDPRKLHSDDEQIGVSTRHGRL